jgi:transcriptional regulator with XRE-family HTH domain
MMDFGPWLREKRTERGLTMQQVADLAGVDQGNLSRIENEHVDATLQTAMPVCSALGVKPSELWRSLLSCELPVFDRISSSDGKGVLNERDILAFLEFYFAESCKGRELLVDLMNRVVIELSPQRGDRTTPHFIPEDIDKLLAVSPMYKLQLSYPPGIDEEIPCQTLVEGGVLMSMEVEPFIARMLRSRKAELGERERKRWAEDFGFSGKRMLNINRVRAGSVRRLKLKEIANLHFVLGDEGEIPVLFWGLAELYENIRQNRERWQTGRIREDLYRYDYEFHRPEFRLASILVITYRWWQHLSEGQDVSWLDHMRQAIG